MRVRIEDVQTSLLTGPVSSDPFAGFDARPFRSAAFVELLSSAGVVGIGETYAGYFFPEVVPSVVDFFCPILVGAEDPLDVPTLVQRMRDCCIFWGRVGLGPTVISAIEAALWDLKGKLLGVPVYELLGGLCHDRLLAYASGGAVRWPAEHDKLRAQLELYLELGYRAVKTAASFYDAAGSQPVHAVAEWEADRSSTIREFVGGDVEILLDAHQGFLRTGCHWDLETARAALDAVTPSGILLFEEPLPYHDPELYRQLRDGATVPVAGGEQLTTAHEFHLYGEAFDIAQPDAAWLGIGDYLEVGRLYAESGRKIASHCWGAGGAAMQNLHASFATEATLIVEGLQAPGPLHTEIWGDSYQMSDGFLLPPEAPGLGVQLTEEIKNRYPFQAGHEEFVSVPGKVLPGETVLP